MKKSYNKGTLSVIIPVYNCERFIEKSIRSALQQTEVTEVVIVDDGSTDASLALAQQIGYEDPRIKIYQHIDKKNKGRSASRNLGLAHVTCEYISFLDADDYYLENRFINDLKVFAKYADCEGVYNAVGFDYYRQATTTELESPELYTVYRKVAPEHLFKNLLYGTCGHFHIDGLTVKKSVFAKTGYFDETLVVAEDTDLFWKMAISSRLFTGVVDRAVAKRGVHEHNIFNNEALYQIYNIKMHEQVAIWASKNKISKAIVDDILKWIWMLKFKQKNKLQQDIKAWWIFFFSQPQLLLSLFFIKYFPIVRFRQSLFPFLFK
jgi:glycosyltransferase involved in cell wall biosynthesis